MEYLQPEERYRMLLEAMVKSACDDVRAYCSLGARKKKASKSYAAKIQQECTIHLAVKSLAWLTGDRDSEISIEAICDALSVRQYRILDLLEEEVGEKPFRELCRSVRAVYGKVSTQ